jgi:hypothetical protein
LNKVKFERNSPADPVNEASGRLPLIFRNLINTLTKANIFPYLSRRTFAITKRKRIPLGPTPKGSDFFEMNPPFPASSHPDTGIRWWWGSNGTIPEPEPIKQYRLPLIDTRLNKSALSPQGLDWLTDYVSDSPLRLGNPYFRPRTEYTVETPEEKEKRKERTMTQEQRETREKEREERQQHRQQDATPHKPKWDLDQRVALNVDGVTRHGK